MSRWWGSVGCSPRAVTILSEPRAVGATLTFWLPEQEERAQGLEGLSADSANCLSSAHSMLSSPSMALTPFCPGPSSFFSQSNTLFGSWSVSCETKRLCQRAVVPCLAFLGWVWVLQSWHRARSWYDGCRGPFTAGLLRLGKLPLLIHPGRDNQKHSPPVPEARRSWEWQPPRPLPQSQDPDIPSRAPRGLNKPVPLLRLAVLCLPTKVSLLVKGHQLCPASSLGGLIWAWLWP